ncbi:MAG: hypothetical protein JXQ77_05030 [Campylobacterales bacterium]|nr:hypothetical protein [Campylobacterales bacterium]
MQCNLIKIGTSKGIRIPANILKEIDEPSSFEMILQNGQLILKPISSKHNRKNWGKAFKAMHKNKDDELLIDDSLDLDML